VKELEERIRRDGHVRGNEVLKVDSFLNHQIDVAFLSCLGAEFHRRFGGCGVTKILTIEASGIGIACITAQFFAVPVVFAKKSQSKNIDGAVYTTRVESFTHGVVQDIIVAKDFLRPEDRVLIVDDFLANGKALEGLCSLVTDAGAVLCGAGIAIEKAFQPGGAKLRARGVRIEALARILSMSEEEIVFDEDVTEQE
jgi:xanthine phosphoribosyltransferase